MSSIVLDNSLEALFSLTNAAVDESLPATPIRNSWPAETRSVDLRLSSTTALMNEKRLDNWAHIEHIVK